MADSISYFKLILFSLPAEAFLGYQPNSAIIFCQKSKFSFHDISIDLNTGMKTDRALTFAQI